MHRKLNSVYVTSKHIRMKKRFYLNTSLFFVLTISLLVHIQSIFVYFVQDDFWLLSLSQIKAPSEFWIFFVPIKEVVWYRPLSSQIFFFFAKLLFNQFPLPYHVVVMIVHLIGVNFLYKTVLEFTHNRQIGLTAALLFGTHQIHTISLSWLSVFSFIFGLTIMLISMFTYIKKSYSLALFFYILGLLSTEVLVVFPLIIVLWDWFQFNKINWKRISTYLMAAFAVVVLRFLIFPTSQESKYYDFSLSVGTFSVVKFYLLRLVGVPMLFDELSATNKIIILLLVSSYLIIFAVGTTFVIRHKSILEKCLFWLVFAFISISPFVMLASHIAPYYATFSLVGISAIFAILIYYFIKKIPVRFKLTAFFIILLLYVKLQIMGINWTHKTHWLYRRAVLAKQLIKSNNMQHPVGSEEYYSLGANKAAEVFLRQ